MEVKIKSLDANDQPVPVGGQVKVTRDYYFDIWVDPNGKEYKGEELKRLQSQIASKGGAFPPALDKQGRGWTLKFQGYEHTDISSQSLKTDASGDGSAAPPEL